MWSDKEDPPNRLSVSSARDTAEAGPNCICHGYTGGVLPRQKHIMENPFVMVIFWGHNYVTNRTYVSAVVQLISDLVTGPFMNGLVQYGVGRGSVVATYLIDTDQNHPAPTTLNEIQAQAQIVSWLKAGNVTWVPRIDETNMLYFLFPPTATQLTQSDGTTGFCGYHRHGKFNDTSESDDLFWAIVDTNSANQTSGQAFANSISLCVSHELAEAFSDRDGQGFITDVLPGTTNCPSGTCEIGDICEANAGGPCCITFQYRGWSVERYWSNWDSACIQGDQPVSVRMFLRSIGFDFRRGLRSLNTPVISLQYMASRE